MKINILHVDWGKHGIDTLLIKSYEKLNAEEIEKIRDKICLDHNLDPDNWDYPSVDLYKTMEPTELETFNSFLVFKD